MRRSAHFILIMALCILGSCSSKIEEDDSCGDEVLDIGEQCDGASLGGTTCYSLGYHGGDLGCTAQCVFDMTGCEGFGRCGDGTVQSTDEQCDDADFNGDTCEAHGYEFGGTLQCNDDCTLDFSLCEGNAVCGDGEITRPEDCEEGDLDGEDCFSLGYYGGVLSCGENCRFDLASCATAGRCGDGVVQAAHGEVCDGTELGSYSCHDVMNTFGYPELCANDCQFETQGCYDGFLHGTTQNESNQHIAVDSLDNLYVFGTTEGNIDGLTHTGQSDMYLSKFLPTGEREWTVLLGGDGYDQSGDIIIDELDNIFLAGSFGYANGSSDAYVAKYDTEGTQIWQTTVGTTAIDHGLDVAVDDAGTVYLVGDTLGAFPGATNAGMSDAFYAVVSAAGALEGVVQFGTAGNDFARGVAFMNGSSNRMILITGVLRGDFTYANTSIVVPGNGNSDIFVAAVWQADPSEVFNLIQIGTAEWDEGNDIIAFSDGAFYVVGETGGALGGVPNQGNGDAVVIHGNFSSGTLELEAPYIETWGTADYDPALQITADAAGNMYIVGQSGYDLMDGSQLSGKDAYVVTYQAGGSLVGVIQLGTTSHDEMGDITVNGQGGVYIVGRGLGDLPGYTNMGLGDTFVMSVPEPTP